MFGFLKKKLKGAISKFSKKVEEEADEEIIEEEIEENVKDQGGEEFSEDRAHQDDIDNILEEPEEKEEVSEKEVQEAIDLIDKAQGEAIPQEVFEKATGISVEQAQEDQRRKEEVHDAVAKARAKSEEDIKQEEENRKKKEEEQRHAEEKRKEAQEKERLQREEQQKKEQKTQHETSSITKPDIATKDAEFIKEEEITTVEDAPSAKEILTEPTPVSSPDIEKEINAVVSSIDTETTSLTNAAPLEKKKEESEAVSKPIEAKAQEPIPSIQELQEKKEQQESTIVPQKIEKVQGELDNQTEEKKGFFSKLKSKFVKKQKIDETPQQELQDSEIPDLGKEKNEEIKIEEEVEKEKLERESQIISEQIQKPDEKIKEEKDDLKKEPILPTPQKTIQEEPKKEEKKGFFAKIKEKVVTKKISEKQFDELFWELEVAMLENNVALEVIEKIKQDLKVQLVDQPIKRSAVEETIIDSLKKSLENLFEIRGEDILTQLNKTDKKPYVICFVGINGSGKTTTIAKIAHLLKEHNKSVVLAAADTFRAAAIDQLEEHAKNLNIKMIKHEYGSDAAAVAFDAIKHAEAKNIDVVLIDTAGRLHSNTNLVDEMKKIIKVANPDQKIFIGESITGNDCVEQAVKFNEAIGIDGIILSKADIDEKGGAAISVSFVTQRPILYIGTGQEYHDLKIFNPDLVMETLGL